MKTILAGTLAPPHPDPLMNFLSIGLSGINRRKPLLIPPGERVRMAPIRYRELGKHQR